MTAFERVMWHYTKSKVLHPEWRKGQTLFNSLYTLYPDVANELRGTTTDPFHQDKRFHQALKWIAERLS